MGRRRALAIVAASALGLACGFSAVGTLAPGDPPVREEAGADGPDEPDAADAAPGVDAQAACLGVCEAGTCVGGTCTITCEAGASCAETVRCPPGVACSVQCTGSTSCANGVECNGASSCAIACSGEDSCGGKILCNGKTCDVRCEGAGTTCSNGISCDAGTCTAICREEDCRNGPVECFSNDCAVLCGVDASVGAGSPSGACTVGVRCTATTSCNVECNGEESCRNGGVAAIAGQNAFVACTGNRSCEGLVAVSAGDGGIVCGPGDGDTCFKGKPKCDGGTCTIFCADGNNNVAGCCSAMACNGTAQSTCTVTTTACP